MEWERHQKGPISGNEAQYRDELEFEQIKAFGEIRSPMANVVEQMKDDLAQGKWEVILADDIGGRNFALIMGEIMSRIAKANGRRRPDMRFVAAGHRIIEQEREDIAAYVASLKEIIGDKRVLVVTDHIETGQTIKNIIEGLIRGGFAFDVVALTRQKPEFNDKVRKSFEVDVESLLPQGSRIFIGEEGNKKGLAFWMRMRSASIRGGASRNDTGLVHSESGGVFAERDENADRILVNTAREFGKDLAGEIYAKYFQNDNLGENKDAQEQA